MFQSLLVIVIQFTYLGFILLPDILGNKWLKELLPNEEKEDEYRYWMTEETRRADHDKLYFAITLLLKNSKLNPICMYKDVCEVNLNFFIFISPSRLRFASSTSTLTVRL